MKPAFSLAALLLLCFNTFAFAAEEDEEPDLTVTQPLSQVEMTCAAKLTRLRSARLWWNDDNRIVAVSLKGIDANDRSIALSSKLPGLRTLVLVALPQNYLTDAGLAPLTAHPELRMLSITGNRLSDSALLHIQANQTLEVVILNGNFTDFALEIISPLPNLTYLDLTQCRVTDAGIAHVSKIPRLKTLILNGTQISNESLQSIAQLKKLTKLFLGDTALDDDAIEQLKTLEQLELLFIKGTNITEQGVQRLLPELPIECEVVHDWGSNRGQRDPRLARVAETSPYVETQWRSAR